MTMMLTLRISPFLLYCSILPPTLSITNLRDSAVTNSEQFRTIHSHIPHRSQQHTDRRYATLSNFGTSRHEWLGKVQQRVCKTISVCWNIKLH